jgi:hypothetical protein
MISKIFFMIQKFIFLAVFPPMRVWVTIRAWGKSKQV